jgi:hypothetical protein
MFIESKACLDFVCGKVAAAAVLLEVQRSAGSEARKEAAQRREIEVSL